MTISLRTLADRDRALQVPCPVRRCGARIGDECRSLATGLPLEQQAAHYPRLTLAGVQPGREWLGPDVPRETPLTGGPPHDATDDHLAHTAGHDARRRAG